MKQNRITQDIEKCAEHLARGDVVAIPTETVYGLAADVYAPQALKKIFALKNRPLFDPLIVHIPSAQKAQDLVKSWPEAAEVLTNRFWPGPLTVVLPRSEKVDDLITAGGETVGLRAPNHPETLTLLEVVGKPLAAPSANQFKKTSPTRSEDVVAEFPDESFLILEGGASEIGIESSVVEILEEENKVYVYRQGWVTPEAIADTLNSAGLDYQVEVKQSPKAPGHLKDHYQPESPLVLLEVGEDANHSELVQKLLQERPNSEIFELAFPENPNLFARKLYATLRKSSKPDRILIARKPRQQNDDAEKWAAIWDRLTKASTK